MKKFFFYFAFLICILIFNGCSDNPNENINNRGNLTRVYDSILIDSIILKDGLLELDHQDPNFIDYKAVYDSIRARKTSLYLVLGQVIEYTSVDVKNREKNLSGIVFFPASFKKIENVPVICLTHATQIMRDLAPSSFPKYLKPSDFPEVVIGIAMAATGYVVCMPDYQGMGKDVSEFHPFCNGELLGKASADMIIATRKLFANNQNISLSSQNFVIGYSEGGYVALATTKEFEKEYPNYTLSGSVPMEGPYDLTGTMIGVMLADTAFPVPYFLPYMIRGYMEVYPTEFNWSNILTEPYLTTLPPLVDGYHNGDIINSAMPKSKVVKEIFNSNFITNLKDPKSSIFQKLYLNNIWFNWNPKTEIMLIHCKKDDCVPYNNTLVTYNEFRIKKGLTNVNKFEPEIYLPFGETVHVQAAPACFLAGYLWILTKTH